MSQSIISIEREIREFLDTTDRAGLKSDKIKLPERCDESNSHTVEFRESSVYHAYDYTGIEPIEFTKECTACADLRWLCINGSEKEICKKICQLYELGGLVEKATRKCAFEIYSMFAPSIVPEDIFGIVGVAVHYKEGDEEFLARIESKEKECALKTALGGLHVTSSVDYLLNAADSVVKSYAKEHPSEVIMTRRGGLWTEYSPCNEGKTYLTRGVFV